jgi:lipopolysaccharide/colanic/teichoic acid biosynthesis glycosyltransferase
MDASASKQDLPLAPSPGLASRRASAAHASPTLERQLTLEHVARADSPIVRPIPRENERSELATRILNVTLASVALLFLLPVLVIVALAVKLTSPGPILYTQTRVGIDRRGRRGRTGSYDRRTRDLGGRVFTIFKFRSMTADAESRSGAVWAQRNDPRVTPLGKVMRKYRIDELPQLLNVVRGDMNIVGPRPERPSIFARLSDQIVEYPLRQRARPGITGNAQVNHSYDTSIDDVRMKVHYDLEYLSRQSIAEDVRIMLKTVPVMLFKKGGW